MEKDISRFVRGYEKSFSNALEELKNERKRTHWMWYIFPQIKGLGRSSRAKYYNIQDREEAIAFLENNYLKDHFLELCNVLLETASNDPKEIFGPIDSNKLRSSMTLFSEVTEDNEIFLRVLDKFFNSIKDPRTIEILKEI